MELILSIVLAIATVAYTIINYKQLLESRAVRKQKITPLIIAYLKWTEDHKVLCVNFKNIGEGCAYNVKVETLKGYNQFDQAHSFLSELTFLKNGANIFPPQYELVYFINSSGKIDYISENNDV